MAKRTDRDQDEIFNDLGPPIHKLKALAEFFFTREPDKEIILSEETRNGVYYLLSGISDDLQSIQDEGEFYFDHNLS